MKKSFSLFLALALMLAFVLAASAAEVTPSDTGMANTNVTLNVDPTYTVTIPDDITLKETQLSDTVQYVGNGEISVSEDMRLGENQVLTVSFSYCDYTLTCDGGTYELPYTVSLEDGTPIEDENATIAQFETPEIAAEQSVSLIFTADNPRYAGNYVDYVTFSIRVDTVEIPAE